MSDVDSVVASLVAEAEEEFGDCFSRSEVDEMLSRELPEWLNTRILSFCAESQNSKQPFEKLNYDTFGHICSYLTLSETCKLRAVSKWTKRMVESIFKRNKELTIHGNTEEKDLLGFAVAYPNVTMLTLYLLDISVDLIGVILKENFRELETLYIEDCEFVVIGAFADCLTSIQNLRLINCGEISVLLSKLKNVRNVEIFRSRFDSSICRCLSKDAPLLPMFPTNDNFCSNAFEKFEKLNTLKLHFERGNICLKKLKSRSLKKLYLKCKDLEGFEDEYEYFANVRQLGLHVFHIDEVKMVRLLSQFTSLESLSLEFSGNNVFEFADYFVQYFANYKALKHFTLIDDFSKVASTGAMIASKINVIDVLKALPRVKKFIVILKKGAIDDTQSLNVAYFEGDLLEKWTYESFCYTCVKKVEAIAKKRPHQQITLSLSSSTLSRRDVLPNLRIV